MSDELANGTSARPEADRSRGLRVAMAVLLGRFEDARRLRLEVHSLAVRWCRLRESGVEEAELNNLLAAGYLVHCVEKGNRAARTFREPPEAGLVPGSCFFLTASGAEVARRLLDGGDTTALAGLAVASETPGWVAADGELRWRGRLAKRFQHEAANQRLLLDAFEARGWAHRIDNPFLDQPGIDGKQQLRETVRSFHDGQHPVVIRLRCDGTGCGVFWEPVD